MSGLLLQEEIFQVIYGCSLFLYQNNTEYISIALNKVLHYNYLLYLYSFFFFSTSQSKLLSQPTV